MLGSVAIAVVAAGISATGGGPGRVAFDAGTAHAAAAQPDFGPHVKIFDPAMPTSEIQATVDAIASQQVDNEMGSQRYALLFKPGIYGTVAKPLVFQVGYYTEVAGLGISPTEVIINGHVDVYNRCFGSKGCHALDNFWRSLSNLTINVTGQSGCRSRAFWAVSQASPVRRVQINGELTFMDYCSGPSYASGGFMADSKTGPVINGSQQQFLVRNSSIGSWSNGVWNQVFAGVQGAPPQSFPKPDPYTTLATNPVSREKPYLYVDKLGNYHVFVPDAATNSSGATWQNGQTPGRSVPLSEFFVVHPADSAQTINGELDKGRNLLFTPGVYGINAMIRVTHPDTVVLGMGIATLTALKGAVVMGVEDVSGVDVAGLMFDAGSTNSPALLKLGIAPVAAPPPSQPVQGTPPPTPEPTPAAGVLSDSNVIPVPDTGTSATPAHGSDPSNPTGIQDVFFRIGGPHPGRATTSLEVASDNVILDDLWAWRADHGDGVGWDVNAADTGVVVNGNDVTATGLFVEHYQKYNVVWNGENGRTIFFQNELPYDPPNQAAWEHENSLGWAAYKVADSVRTHELWGGGSYIFTNADPSIRASRGFEVPNTAGVKMHDLLTVDLGAGTIDHVINDKGDPVTPAQVGQPSDVVSYP